MIDTRRKHQCHKNGCDCQATLQACLRFWCTGMGKPPVEMRCTTTVQLCDRHKTAATEFILSPGNKAVITAAIAKENLQMPDFSSAEVVFVPIVDGRPADVAA